MSGSQAHHPAHLEPSELGTKEYWDKLYANEVSNHAADPDDIGTVWFDDSDAQASIVDYLDSLAAPCSADDGSALLSKQASLLDLGCGNGSLLLALRAAGWSGRALGVDYSQQGIALARSVAAHASSCHARLLAPDFLHWDIINGPLDALATSPACPALGWDLVLDKGTFDAISLAHDVDAHGRRLADCYRQRVLRLVRPNGGLFLITSCNWTDAELHAWFADQAEPSAPDAAPDGRFQVAGHVKYKTFSFGGVKGQTISTVLFQKV
ncbi:hypothetical protein CDD81_6922 [Ophiocordyceps australis]|uniref:Protein-lysine N-methyltransferase EFM4 n=1 Tax=Ophiocordyceps australis TaxID=1399860 RepID=A0A2C5Y4C7_9HYPO|nr:hypothetical protein CDD81_6922 [Ophiocordyceps australis]